MGSLEDIFAVLIDGFVADFVEASTFGCVVSDYEGNLTVIDINERLKLYFSDREIVVAVRPERIMFSRNPWV